VIEENKAGVLRHIRLLAEGHVWNLCLASSPTSKPQPTDMTASGLGRVTTRWRG
jgi:hypothetical protein